jgi:hypothetical protein
MSDVYVWQCKCGETFDDASLPEQRSLHVLTRHTNQQMGNAKVPTCKTIINPNGATCGAPTLRAIDGVAVCTVHYDMAAKER